MIETVKKLKLKGKGIVINSPANLKTEFEKHSFKTELSLNEKNENTLIFINNKTELLQFLEQDLKNIESDSVLWFAYPKGTSKMKTDINRDSIRETVEKYNITTVSAILIDETWSGLRFRPIDKVGKK